MTIGVCIAGATGWVGSALARAVADSEDLELTAAVSRTHAGKVLGELLGDERLRIPIRASVDEAVTDRVDVLIDYTKADAVKRNALTAIDKGKHVVIGTSGLTDADYEEIHAAALGHSVGVFAAGNFAISATLLQVFAAIAAKHIPHWEIIDYFSAGKMDAPSGTARELAYKLSQVRRPEIEVPIEKTFGMKESRGATLEGSQVHSVRLPGFISSAEIVFGLPGERLSIRHDSTETAQPYVGGTLLAVRKIQTLKGLVRGLANLLEL